jgi:hypothetical protein
VRAGDYVLQPYEPALNWTRFGITLPQVNSQGWVKAVPCHRLVFGELRDERHVCLLRLTPHPPHRSLVIFAMFSSHLQSTIPTLHYILPTYTDERYKEMQAS